MTPRRGAEGRPLARAQVSLASGARVEDALERLGHEVAAIDVGADLVARLRERRPGRRVRRAARPRRRGRHGAGAARGARDPLHRLARPRLHALLGQGADQARAARRRPADARLGLARRDRASASSAPPRRSRAIEQRLGVPARGQARLAGLLARRRRSRARRRGAGGADRRLLLRPQGAARARTSTGRELAVSILAGEAAARAGAADRRGGAARARVLRLRRALRDRPHRVRLPAGARAGRSPSACARSRWRRGSCSAAAASRAST